MTRLKHVVRNTTDRPQFITFELSTERYRLIPGDALFFFYESEHGRPDEPPLIMDFISTRDGMEIVIWTNFGSEEGPFLASGQEAVTDWEPP